MEESFYNEAFRQFRTKDFPQFRNTSFIFSDIHAPKLFPKYVIVSTAYEIRCAGKGKLGISLAYDEGHFLIIREIK